MAEATSFTYEAIVALLATKPDYVRVVTGLESRPPVSGIVFWIGGTTRPPGALSSDVWLKEIPTSPSIPEFITTSLNTMSLGVAFSQALLMNGTTPMTFAIIAGSLPTSMTMHTGTGVISGTPTVAGAYSFTVRATNTQGSQTQVFTGTVSTGVIAPDITTTALTSLTQGTAFSQTINATGTSPAFTIAGGSLPAGLSLNSATGAITGAPTGSGAYSFTVQATNSAGTDTQLFTGTIAATGTSPDITTTVLNSMQAGVAFTQTLARTGSSPMTWGVSSGSIPAGLALNSSTGVISGTPTTAGAYSFTVQVTNSFGSDTQAYSGTIAPAVSAGEYTIFGATVPSTLTSYSDADAGSWVAHQYYVYSGGGALSAGSKIIAARLYVPPGSAHIGQTWQAALIRKTDGHWMNPVGGGWSGQSQFESNGTKTTGSALVAGWNEVLFSAEQDVVTPGNSWAVGVKIGDGTRYLHNASAPAFGAGVQAEGGKNFYLADGVTSGQVQRSFYRDSSSNAAWYGIDVKVRVP